MEKINYIIRKIRKLRDDKNLTMVKMAKDLNMNRATLYNYIEKNETDNLTVEFLYKCSEYFNVPITYFLQEETIEIDIYKNIDLVFDEIKLLVKERIRENKK